ncbi:SIMPL domain-containing protein [Flavobacterium psychraquaticum]|uniref:SIMPL domain-containing protein n=1 Tax=Flavobacterium psychraquaticum TaxID=3103958 RepID=UPI002ACD265A|nr:SIMPL domain-containing protein [Flavobacterium sp. LB-N7T]
MKTQFLLLNEKIKFFIVLFLLTTFASLAQISGNQIYENSDYSSKNYNQTTTSNSTSFSINDNNLSFTIKILLNNKADGFIITLGLNEENESVSGCNQKINSRLNGFIGKLKAIGIKPEHTYVDFISQTKIYDFTTNDLTAKQFEKGFEIKKNIIISTSNVVNLEKIITLASEYEIYDVIKVDYFNTDLDAIHNSLFDEALRLAESKKVSYLKAFGKRIVGTPTATENFTTFLPKSQYKTYQAFESSEIQTNSNSRAQYLKKMERKNKTFYYDGMSNAGYDKVINANQTEVGIQYAITLTVSYKIDTSI